MNTIKSKLILIYILVFIAVATTIGSSYIAVNTQKQHLVLTELLSKQKLLVERVTFTIINTAEIAKYDKSNFKENKDENTKYLKEYEAAVDFMLGAFTNKAYPLDGKIVKLSFSSGFTKIFNPAIEETVKDWEQTKVESVWLLDENNLKNDVAYALALKQFKTINDKMIEHADYLTKICREEAERKKQASENIQIASVIFVIFIFLYLIYFVKKNIETPIFQIRKAFNSMGRGDFNIKLERKNKDEFKVLFNDFNRFIDSHKIIKDIENNVLQEDSLSEILTYMKKSFSSFIPIKSISIFYEDILGRPLKYNSENFSNSDIDFLEKYDTIAVVEKNRLILPININNVYLGYAEFNAFQDITDNNIKFMEELKEKIGLAFYKSLLFKDLLAIVTNGLSDLTEARDPETKRHLIRMSYYSTIIAKELRKDTHYKNVIDEAYIENILLVSPMHDIGKVSVPDSILLKPGKLDDEEFEIMKTHAYEGAKVLRGIHDNFKKYNLNYFKMAQEIANFHQEKFNGTGYPDKISGEQIPLSARISAVADVFDALTSKRTYKDAFSLEKSYSIIRESSGSHFDPHVVEAFFSAQEEIEKVYNQYKEV